MANQSRWTRLTLGLLLLALLAACSDNGDLYRDANQPVEVRVKDLLARMTLEEKGAQVTCLWNKPQILDSLGHFDVARASALLPDGVGCIARPSDRHGMSPSEPRYREPRESVNLINAIQDWAVNGTRLGIPVLTHEEALHGLESRWATHFPQAIALAGTFDDELVERVFSRAALEVRVRGSHHVLAPVVDVARDPRWGRIEETYGEDPYLVSRMGVAAVLGFQGPSLPVGPDKVLATLKHMTGHGQPESGTNVGPAQISERTLREVFFPPFQAAIQEANASSVMASYNEIDGIPSHANRWLLGEILRGEWGFEGMVVADYNAIAELEQRHHVAVDKPDAARQALLAGVDMELPDRDVYLLLPELVRQGVIDESDLDRAVARVLRAKFLSGVFDDPFADAERAERITGDEQGRALALEAARKSIVLLRNENQLLPLDGASIRRLAVIGPNAARVVLGGYSDKPRVSVSILDGIRELLGPGVQVTYSEGARITDSEGWTNDEVVLPDRADDEQRIRDAVSQAARAHVAVVVVGDNEQTSREAWSESHLGDRTSLELVGRQEEMVRRIVATGTPTVVVLNHGRPLAVNWIAENVDAILDTWYLGQETGTAVAEALFGAINPGAKLAVTVPRNVGQLPMFYNHKPTARRGYLFDTTEPLFPFGFGLSYTTFEFSNLRLASPEIQAGDSVAVLVDVTNTGFMAGDEVVQLYVRDDVSSVTRPVKELKGFRRITLEPGQRQSVSLTLRPADLAVFNHAMDFVVEPGTFTVMVGPSSVDLQSTKLTVK